MTARPRVPLCLLVAGLAACAEPSNAPPEADAARDVAGGGGAHDATAGTDAPDAEPAIDLPVSAAVTYWEHVAPVVFARCVGCHTEGGMAGLSFEDEATVATFGELMVHAVETGQMPPWLPSDACRPIEETRRLTADEIAVFTEWGRAGHPLGDRARFTRPERTDALGAPSITLAPRAAYTPNPALPDDYHCLALDGTFDRETFVRATDVIPGARAVVHHALVYEVRAEDVPELERLDAAEDGPGYTCFGGPGASSGGPVAGWVPGMVPARFPEGSAVVLRAGSRLVIQLHYNTTALDGPPPADTSRVALWTLPAGDAPEEEVVIVGVADADFVIPAGDPEVETTELWTVPWFAEVIGVAPHMHRLGASISGSIVRAGGEEACLVDIPGWDFNWQQFYLFSEPSRLPVAPGDAVNLTCRFDNSAANQPVVNGERLPPRDVGWGEGTDDEMCLLYVIATTPYFQDDGTMCGAYAGCHRACDAGDASCFAECLPATEGPCGACLFDGLNACITDHCPIEGFALVGCLGDCSASTLECLTTVCRPELDTVYACIDPFVRDGSCNAALAPCELEY